LAAIVTVTALTAACGADDEVGPQPTTGHASGALQRAESCEQLLEMQRADALYKMNAAIDAQIEWLKYYVDYGYGSDVSVAYSASYTASATSAGTTVTTGTGPSGSTGSGSNGGLPPPNGGAGGAGPSHSTTNNQVEGVDEADIVKTDGKQLYVLHGQTLQILRSWPAAELSVAATVPIEGAALQMFLAGDRVVVYSRMDGTKLFQQAGITPPQSYDYGYPAVTKITVVSLAGGKPHVARELYFEGGYTSSRRIGPLVRSVLSGGHHLSGIEYDPSNYYEYSNVDALTHTYEMLRAKNAQRIKTAQLHEFLPYRFVRKDGALQPLEPSCTDFYVPAVGSAEDGLVQIQSLDLEKLDAGVAETTIVGAATTIYSSLAAMYVAAPTWKHSGIDSGASTTVFTHLHKFDLAGSPAKPSYRGSGSVPGRLINQFALDEKDGFLRVATSDFGTSHLLVLGEENQRLVRVGAVTGLAPGEQLYSVRFVGSRGYLVTFRKVDPLFVFDLSVPAEPTLIAELKIPGFSEYMHPLDGGSHLLTIGRDATEQGQVLGVALQIFDVRDAKTPKLVHKHMLSGEGWSQSEAEHEHKAFTYYQGMLAIPLSRWDYQSHAASSTLELFQVDVTKGFSHRGSIDHSALFAGWSQKDYGCSYYGLEVRRSVFIEDHVYSISGAGVLAHAVADLSKAVGSVSLPKVIDDYCYYP
jgi:hypothetical protein